MDETAFPIRAIRVTESLAGAAMDELYEQGWMTISDPIECGGVFVGYLMVRMPYGVVETAVLVSIVPD